MLQRVDAILQFITDFTVDVEGVGHVCRFQCVPSLIICQSSSVSFINICYRFLFIMFFAALVPLILGTMAIANMVRPLMLPAPRGVPRGKWKNHS